MDNATNRERSMAKAVFQEKKNVFSQIPQFPGQFHTPLNTDERSVPREAEEVSSLDITAYSNAAFVCRQLLLSDAGLCIRAADESESCRLTCELCSTRMFVVGTMRQVVHSLNSSKSLASFSSWHTFWTLSVNRFRTILTTKYFETF